MKKVLSIFLCVLMLVCSVNVFGCGKEPDLRVYNCYDYIDESLIDDFEKYIEEKTGNKIYVSYEKFTTPEDAYTSLKIYPDKYDLLCPSDYMIEKMAREGRLEEITLSEDGAYNTNVSPYIRNKFNSVKWTDASGEEKTLANYAAGYMWGTLGLLYNPNKVNRNDMKTWKSLWTEKYKHKFSIKDSVRDTYFIGLANYHYEDLISTTDKYELFNDTTKTTVDAVQSLLVDLVDRSSGLEVDEGKLDIISGIIDINFAWSGDAVFAMDTAEDSDMVLEYSVPEEGSNVWFDGWCVPKNAKNKELALEFIDFLSRPDSVIRNMEEIGYVSCIAGEEIFEYVKETYEDVEAINSVNLDYFFKNIGDDKTYTVKCDNKNGQFSAQYPEKTVIDRCSLMSYFDDTANSRIMNMWLAATGN